MGDKFDIHYEGPKKDLQPYRNANFQVGDSPAILDVLTDVGRITYNGEIDNDGAGDLIISLSSNGTDYTDQSYLKAGEQADLRTFETKKIKIEHSGIDSAYRCRVW